MTVFDDMLGDANGIYQDADFSLSGRFIPKDGTPPTAVRIMKHEPDSFAEGRVGRVAVSGLAFALLQAELPVKPVQGDVLHLIATADGATAIYDVEHATADEQRLEWFVAVNLRQDPTP